MEYVKLKNGKSINVSVFDDETNKEYPYYQNGSRFALCPYCCSVVNIKGRRENKNQSTQQKMYASHHTKTVSGLELKRYEDCPFYQGNKGNWQGVYQIDNKNVENEKLKEYINDNKDVLAKELTTLTGIAFKNKEGVNSLFNNIYQSFVDNGGLYRKYWHPDMVSRIMLINSEQVEFWGYVIQEQAVINKIKKRKNFCSGLKTNNQFKSDNVSFVATMDNNENPNKINIKLICKNDELVLKKISAKYTL